MYEQLLLHLVGDYITQTNWMATNKTKMSTAAIVHALTYSLPFLLLKPSAIAFAIILITHFFIDRFRLIRYVIFVKNKITDWDIKWKDCSDTGYPNSMPLWLSVWLMILADNTAHLVINYSALRWF